MVYPYVHGLAYKLREEERLRGIAERRRELSDKCDERREVKLFLEHIPKESELGIILFQLDEELKQLNCLYGDYEAILIPNKRYLAFFPVRRKMQEVLLSLRRAVDFSREKEVLLTEKPLEDLREQAISLYDFFIHNEHHEKFCEAGKNRLEGFLGHYRGLFGK